MCTFHGSAKRLPFCCENVCESCCVYVLCIIYHTLLLISMAVTTIIFVSGGRTSTHHARANGLQNVLPQNFVCTYNRSVPLYNWYHLATYSPVTPAFYLVCLNATSESTGEPFIRLSKVRMFYPRSGVCRLNEHTYFMQIPHRTSSDTERQNHRAFAGVVPWINLVSACLCLCVRF